MLSFVTAFFCILYLLYLFTISSSSTFVNTKVQYIVKNYHSHTKYVFSDKLHLYKNLITSSKRLHLSRKTHFMKKHLYALPWKHIFYSYEKVSFHLSGIQEYDNILFGCYIKCRCVGMADDADSKSVGSNPVRVQVPPPAVLKWFYCI